jgi:hypothetical protein
MFHLFIFSLSRLWRDDIWSDGTPFEHSLVQAFTWRFIIPIERQM